MGNVTIPVGETDQLVTAYLRNYFETQKIEHGRKGMTQARLARAIHISEPRLTRLMSGQTSWHTPDLDKLADFLGTTVPEITQGPLREEGE